MFNSFSQVWTPLVASRDLRRKPLRVSVAGEPVVLFREAGGRIGALLDRCPHRGASLALGTVDAAGCLHCPFHDWSFRADGSCAAIPLSPMPESRRAHYAATALPARDLGGLIWVFTDTHTATEPEPPPALITPGWRSAIHIEDWNAHWTRAMENMLDMPHVPFVHRRTIGRGMRRRIRADSELNLDVRPEPWGASFSGRLDGTPTGASLEWRRPNAMVLDLSMAHRGMRMHVFCVPLDSDHTRMILVASRTFWQRGPAAWIANWFNRLILREDRSVVESSRPIEVPKPGDERSVGTDAPTLHFRKYYFRSLRHPPSTQRSPATGFVEDDEFTANPQRDSTGNDAETSTFGANATPIERHS